MTVPVIIIGAGAAGIGAGLKLKALNVPFIIVEAKSRVGGRAYTDKSSLSFNWDQGCSWFHCAGVNPLLNWADKLGTTYATEDQSSNSAFLINGNWLDKDEGKSIYKYIQDQFNAIYDNAQQGKDIPISKISSGESRNALIAKEMMTLMCSEEPKFTSAFGYADYEDTDKNLVVTSGYGDLIQRMAVGLPVSINTIVTAIRYHKTDLKVHTNIGELDAKAVIVTASTNALHSGQIDMPRGSVCEVLEALEGTPCGTYEKVAIELDNYPFDPSELESIWLQTNYHSEPIYFQILGHKKPVLIAHIAGRKARKLILDGNGKLEHFATEHLISAFGANIRKSIKRAAETAWQTDPFIQGGYSYAKIGAAENRRKMIQIETDRIVFAGEAFSLQWYGTAHGAYQSGQDVAEKLMAQLAHS